MPTPSTGGSPGTTVATPPPSTSGQFNPGLLEYVTVFQPRAEHPERRHQARQRASAACNGLRNPLLTTALGSSNGRRTAIQAAVRPPTARPGAGFRSVVDFCTKATVDARRMEHRRPLPDDEQWHVPGRVGQCQYRQRGGAHLPARA